MIALALVLLADLSGFPRMGAPARDPERAAARERVAAVFEAIDAATDDVQLRAELRRICIRESWCNWYGIVDSHGDGDELGRRRWRRAVKLGLLHPNECPAHELGDDPDLWGTVGAFGTVAAFVVRHAGPCVGPAELARPELGARAALGHIEVLCDRQRACSCEQRTAWWAGPGKWARRSPLQQLSAVSRQCGEQPTLSWLFAYASLPLWHGQRIVQSLEDLFAALPSLPKETIAS